ncbi:hypothetical protein GGH95_001316 [Coemansia sp. RSA 1836]|nr:hypothetical protein IWW47_000009 [Coemansia sp. RSA 2052]KAJ2582845.1 hypothetical protein GGH95_001316 [Coemansia sp. RSA 1836]
MQFTKTILALAAMAVAAIAADIDWTSQPTLDCVKSSWSAIKAKADPMLPMAAAILTPAQAAALASLLNGSTTLPANPSDAFLRALPSAIPASLLNTLAGSYIDSCLATHTVAPPVTSAPPATSAPPPATSAPPTSSAPPASSAAPTQPPAYTTEPAKCVPHY